jgi:hypothetical protein
MEPSCVPYLRFATHTSDRSECGNQINGLKIGKGKTYILREGNEVAFGISTPQHQNGGVEDYRQHQHLFSSLAFVIDSTFHQASSTAILPLALLQRVFMLTTISAPNWAKDLLPPS